VNRPAAATTASTLQSLFATALQHHQAGRLNEAEPLYHQVVTALPRHADSLHLLGVIAHQNGTVSGPST